MVNDLDAPCRDPLGVLGDVVFAAAKPAVDRGRIRAFARLTGIQSGD